MRRLVIYSLLSLALGASLVSAVSAAERAPAGSFLTHRATSVNELCNQLRTDPAVRLRYARHFGVSPDEITEYFAKNVKLVSLDKPLRTTTWYVGRSGKIYTKTKLFPKGTMMFVEMSTNKPLLSWSCGNPVSAHLPLVKKPVVEEKVLPAVETIAAAAVTAPPAPEVLATTPVAAPPPTGVFSVPPVAIPPAVSSNPALWWLPALALIPPPPPPPPVPEPTSLLAMAVGITGLVGLRNRRLQDRR